MPDKKTVYIFWTAGFDSTYRIVELSRMDVNVQALYCKSPVRRSAEVELQHMKDIISMLAKKPETKATFLPIKEIDITTLPADENIEEAHRMINKELILGTQYIFLAKVAKNYPGVELGIEKVEYGQGHCTAAIKRFGGKLIMQDGKYCLDKSSANSVCYKIFGQMTFPIFDKTEKEMLANIRKWGYEDIIKHIWFCHTPLKENGEWTLCGVCNPCRAKIEGKMEFLLPPAAQKRYRAYKKIERIGGKNMARFLLRLSHFYKVKNFLVK